MTSTRDNYACLEQVVGCKWSVSVLMAVQAGVCRPGMLERYIEGISNKVLSERLRKLCAYELLVKEKSAGLPAKTEYIVTDKGAALVGIIQQIHELDQVEKVEKLSDS